MVYGRRPAPAAPKAKAAPILRPTLDYQRSLNQRDYDEATKEWREAERLRAAEERKAQREAGLSVDLGAAGKYAEQAGSKGNGKTLPMPRAPPSYPSYGKGEKAGKGKGKGKDSRSEPAPPPRDVDKAWSSYSPQWKADDWNTSEWSSKKWNDDKSSWRDDDKAGWSSSSWNEDNSWNEDKSWNEDGYSNWTASNAPEKEADSAGASAENSKAAHSPVRPLPGALGSDVDDERLNTLLGQAAEQLDNGYFARRVEVLDLAGSAITDAGVTALAGFLMKHRVAVATLRLNECASLRQPQAIVDLLKDEKCGIPGELRELWISEENFSKECFWRILEVCTRSKPTPPFRLAVSPADAHGGRLVSFEPVLAMAEKYGLRVARAEFRHGADLETAAADALLRAAAAVDVVILVAAAPSSGAAKDESAGSLSTADTAADTVSTASAPQAATPVAMGGSLLQFQ